MIWAILAAGAAIAGGVAGAVSASKQSKAAQSVAEANQTQAQKEAAQLQEVYSMQLSDLRTQQKRFSGQQKALIGRSGVKLTSGSPLALRAETARAMAEDQRRLQLQGEYEVGAREFEAGQYGEEARAYRKTRPWQVGASLLGGFGQGASYFL